jgi:DNA-binding transcriptional MerR regulator
MKIGDVSAKLGIPASAIRYYEKVGLIEKQRRIAGRRDFDDRALFALEFVRLAQAAGFSIVEMKSLLEAYAENPSATGTWKTQALAKRRAIRTQIDDLRQMDQMLSEILSCSCPSLTQCIEKGSARLALS